MLQTQEKCIALLEEIRWSGKPVCPYCNSINSTKFNQSHRYHCNSCFTSFSVTVGTLFHRTHIKLPKWFKAIELVTLTSPNISSRKLAAALGVNRNTAAYMISRIRKCMESQNDSCLKQILQSTQECETKVLCPSHEVML